MKTKNDNNNLQNEYPEAENPYSLGANAHLDPQGGSGDEDLKKEIEQRISADQETHVESKSTNQDKERKRTEHEAGISRGSILTPTSNSNAGREI